MLFPTDTLRRRRAEIARQHQDGKISDLEAGTQLIETDLECASGYLLLAGHRVADGDLAGAEAYAWQALQRMPCDSTGYLTLANLLHKQAKDDAAARRLMALGFWKVSFQQEVPAEVAESLGGLESEARLDFSDPSEYAALAIELDEQAAAERESDDRLLPYELLNDIETEAEAGLEPELLDRILRHSAVLIPLWRAALRRWADTGDAPDADALGMIIALLGETAGPEVLADLMELVESIDPVIFLHANWAVWRLGQRFPAEVLAALGSADRVSRRCAAAEHILLLPETPGRAAAASRLLEGFAEFAKDNDAAFLLAAVMSTLEQMGRPTDAERALRQYQKLLPKDGRRWVQDELEAGFVGRLEDADIEGLTIEDVCSERILLEEEEDDEDGGDFDAEEEDEFGDVIEPAIAPVKPGRNDPCWCGSGKKYKKCHLTADDETERGGRKEGAEPLHERLYKQLADGLRDRSTFEEASRLYFGKRPNDVDAKYRDDQMTGFFDWCFHDFRPSSTGRTLIEECLHRRAGNLSSAERELLEGWLGARFGIWEVQNVKMGEGVELKDWFEGDRVFVHDVSSSRTMLQWDCVQSRVYSSEGRWYFAGNGIAVPRDLMDRLAELVERESRESGQSAGAFVRANSHRWHRVVEELFRHKLDDLRLVNAEGDEFELSAAEYRVEDEAAAAAALRRTKQFESLEDAPGLHRFGWMEQAEGPRRTYGSIEISGGKLRLDCNSRKRLAIGRQLVEKHAGNWLRHEGDSFHSQDALKQSAYDSAREREEETSELPPDVERELLKLKVEHYERWVDEPVPALGGRTPREAARSETGRRALEDLLRLMENSEAHARGRSGPTFDFSQVRKRLGM
jgi:hypothetical protein